MGDANEGAVPSAGLASELVRRWGQGDEQALAELMPLIYAELKRLASHYMRQERDARTLQTTALIHETYVRLAGGTAPSVAGKAHFFALAGRLMRQILIDHARNRNRLKRGGGMFEIALDDAAIMSEDQSADLLALDQALDRLAKFDERKARVVELRYFAGLEVSEAAVVLGVSENTVIRDWALARAWLQQALGPVPNTAGHGA